MLLQLKWIGEAQAGHGAAPPGAKSRSRRERLLWAAAAVALAVLAAAAARWLQPGAPPERHAVARFQFSLPEDQSFTRAGRHVLAC